jgi:ABC-type branched-subunit amino acid transport system ATPase component
MSRPPEPRDQAARRGERLVVDDLAVAYRNGGVAISGLSLSVGRGEIIVLLGPNGAGKTSALRGIAGFLRREPGHVIAGTIRLGDADLTRRAPLRRARLGLVLVPEEDKIFRDLTVEENLQLGGMHSPRAVRQRQLDMALGIFPDLRAHMTRKAGYLSGGQRQMLAIASALCADPKVMLIDAPTIGLAPERVEAMTECLRVLGSQGIPILMAEENAGAAMAIATSVVLIEAGHVLRAGSPGLLEGADISRAFLGGAEQ